MQAEVARLRTTVLHGRGPDASTSEFLQGTRARSRVGGVPVAERRERVARAAAAAGNDAEALALEVAADRDRLAGTLGAVRAQLQPGAVRGRARARLSSSARRRPARLSALVLGVAVLVRWRRRR